MAPLKLKFRMGSSRNTSQETQELDTTDTNNINQSLLNNPSMNNDIRDSNSTIDSIDCTSLDSTGGNDKKSLLPTNITNDRLGYLNPAISQNSANSFKMNDNKIENLDLGSRLSISTDNSTSAIPLSESSSGCNRNSSSEYDGYCAGSSSDFNNSINLNNSSQSTSIEQISTNSTSTCMEPNCKININNNHLHQNNNKKQSEEDICKESIDSREYLITPGSEIGREQQEPQEQHENNIDNSCTGSCETLYQQENYTMNSNGRDGKDYAYDESNNYNDNNSVYNGDNPDDERNDDYSDRSWHSNTTQIISNKSSKKIYKAVAKQFGITCTMSDQCRCMECQSNYFDCEFDENNEHQKMDHTDGGLGAGTPMFISEVMHGSACNIL